MRSREESGGGGGEAGLGGGGALHRSVVNGAGSGACSEQPSDWRREPRVWADEGDAG